MTIFASLLLLLPLQLSANLTCGQAIFSETSLPEHFSNLKANLETKADFHLKANREAATLSLELVDVVTNFQFDSPQVKTWAVHLANTISAQKNTISYADYLSFSFRLVALLSIKEAPRNFELDRRRFESSDFETTKSLVSKLERLNLSGIKLPIQKIYPILRATKDLPDGYLLYPTLQATPVAVMNNMLATKTWVLAVSSEAKVQHGISMSPLAQFTHDLLHFHFYIEGTRQVSPATLTKLRNSEINFKKSLSPKDLELFDYAFFFWWFEKPMSDTNLANFYTLKDSPSTTPAMKQDFLNAFTKEFSWSLELPATWSSQDISRSIELIHEFQRKLFEVN